MFDAKAYVTAFQGMEHQLSRRAELRRQANEAIRQTRAHRSADRTSKRG